MYPLEKKEMHSVTFIFDQKTCAAFSVSKYSRKVFRKQRCTKPTKAPMSKITSNR